MLRVRTEEATGGVAPVGTPDRRDPRAFNPAGPERGGMATDEPGGGTLGAAVVTVSSVRSLSEDEPGDAIVAAFEGAGHELATRELIAPGFDNVQSVVSRLVGRKDVDVVVTTGSTGVGPEDATLEAVGQFIEKELTAFSQLFTRLGYEEVGTGVLRARSLGGVSDGVAVFCLPDDVAATRLAAESIIVPEAPAIVEQARGEDEVEE